MSFNNCVRKNTVSVDFHEVEEKPSHLEIHLFIKNVLELELADIEAIGIYGTKAVIKLINETKVEELFEKYLETVFTAQNGKQYKIRLCNESKRTVVKVHRVPLEIPDAELKKSLSMYGNVEEVRKECWKNLPFPVYNELRSVKMEINRPIPSYINIGNQLYWVTYFGQEKTCKRCGKTTHEAKDCSYGASQRISNYSHALRPDLGNRKQFPVLPEINSNASSFQKKTQENVEEDKYGFNGKERSKKVNPRESVEEKTKEVKQGEANDEKSVIENKVVKNIATSIVATCVAEENKALENSEQTERSTKRKSFKNLSSESNTSEDEKVVKKNMRSENWAEEMEFEEQKEQVDTKNEAILGNTISEDLLF